MLPPFRHGLRDSEEAKARLQQLNPHLAQLRRVRAAARGPHEDADHPLHRDVSVGRSERQRSLPGVRQEHLVELAHDLLQKHEGRLQLLRLHFQQADEGLHLAGGVVTDGGRRDALQSGVLDARMGHGDHLEHQLFPRCTDHASHLRVQHALQRTEEGDKLDDGLEDLDDLWLVQIHGLCVHLRAATTSLPETIEALPLHGQELHQNPHLMQRSDALSDYVLALPVLAGLVGNEQPPAQSKRARERQRGAHHFILEDTAHVLHQLAPVLMAVDDLLYKVVNARQGNQGAHDVKQPGQDLGVGAVLQRGHRGKRIRLLAVPEDLHDHLHDAGVEGRLGRRGHQEHLDRGGVVASQHVQRNAQHGRGLFGIFTGIRSVHLEVQTSQDGGQQLAKAYDRLYL
mmetsp:Transcript_105606/g.251741  ORF Transcript_105606/g.251741 Transcript_105606/m.251741 type:complete len:399 (-) Transcript_105606:1548-2744(-)